MQIRQEERFVPGGGYIYRVSHRIMEGDCPCDHGPRWVEVPDLCGQISRDQRHVSGLFTSSGYIPPTAPIFLKHWRDGRPLAADLDKPVTWVSPNDARGDAAFYGKTLPTDAEWQYFASGRRAA